MYPAMFEGAEAAGVTPVPNTLIDHLLPDLKDTELRVLLVVLRQTVGRGGKPADWLSHRQLKARTGRASEAIAAAVDALVRGGCLLVTDSAGLPLSTPAERRRYQGKLYYRPGRLVQTGMPSGQHHGKSKTTDRDRVDCRFRKAEDQAGDKGRLLPRQYGEAAASGLLERNTPGATAMDDAVREARINQEKQRIRQRLACLAGHDNAYRGFRLLARPREGGSARREAGA
jgi:hypothetical protein